LNGTWHRFHGTLIAYLIRAQPGEPMTMEEIQTEVDAVRAERRAREARR
jgi:hypothetical protein